MSKHSAFVVLAAGKGTRMRSGLPKVLHHVGGSPMVGHVVRLCRALGDGPLVVVTGHGAEAVEAAVRAIAPEAGFAAQSEQLGTAHAVAQAKAALVGATGDIFVLYGDTPLIEVETLTRMRDLRQAGAAVVVLGFHAADPTGYGRLVVDADGGLQAIVEEKEADAAQKAIRFCNSGVMCVDGAALWDLLDGVSNDNAKGEYYLTDIVEIARARGLSCVAAECDEAEVLGVNSRVDLAAAEAAFQARRRRRAMLEGATLTAPETVFFSYDTVLGSDVIVGPHVVFGPGVRVEDNVEIRAYSHLEGARVAAGAQVGPYARLRPGADIASGARIGNFVEIKSATIEVGAKVNHLSYIGDARVGPGANIGAGTITCNYDGYFKHRTDIGAGAFIGSNSALVAPISIGAGALVAAGSTVTKDVEADALATARGKQENKPGLAKRLRDRLSALKAARKKE